VKVNVTVPLPVPLAPDVTLIHEVLLDAVHEQVLAVETLIDAVPLPRPSRRLVGETEYEHEAGGDGGCGLLPAACVTVKGRPAMVSVPVRSTPLFAATLNVTEPLPVRVVPPDVTVIQDALLAAVH
jgi:hypothetical protein